MAVQVLVPLALLGNGVVAGIMFSTVIGLVPLTLVLPYQRYVAMIQFLWPRYDPFMPITNVAVFALDIALLLLTWGGGASTLFAGAAGLLGVVMAISVAKNVPINRYVMSLDPETPPGDWVQRDPRVRWRNWNTLRTFLALLALLANLAAAALLL